MSPNEIETKLRAFIASHGRDPVVAPFVARATALDAQLQTATRTQTEAERADVDATLAAERALVRGDQVDNTVVLHRLRAAVADAAHTVRLTGNALARVRRDIAHQTAARAQRDIATLTPLFRELVALYDERASAVVEIQELLHVAHDVANAVLPGASSDLQQGFGGPLTRTLLDAWRQRVDVAGLRVSKTRRVA